MENYVSTNPNRVEIKFFNNVDLTGEPIITKYFDATNLSELTYTKNKLSNANNISFEIFSQTGNVQVIDKDTYTFEQLNNEGFLSNNKVLIYKNGKKDAEMYLYNPQKDINSIHWQFSLTDEFSKYKERQFLGMGYGSKTARQCLDFVLGQGNYQLDNISDSDAYLDRQIPNAYLTPDTMWNTLNKICSFALTTGFIINGQIIFSRSI